LALKLLVLASNYPHAGHVFSGIFNERSVLALSELCEDVTVLSPRPFVPPIASSLVSRWNAYAMAARYEIRNGVPVYRPSYIQIPLIGPGFSHDYGAFLCCRRVAKEMQRRSEFNAILAFDVVGTGAMGWRLGRTLRVPAATWITGHIPKGRSHSLTALRAVARSDIVFYQSRECLEAVASLIGKQTQLAPARHVVLPRGIPEPPLMSRVKIREQIRNLLGVADRQTLVVSIGRITRAKGILELIKACTLLRSSPDVDIACVVVGSLPAFDETRSFNREIERNPLLRNRLRLLPACSPDKMWEYLCAADIFAFSSHQEGMPNSLLEAMAMGVPVVAFGIRPVLEIDAGTGSISIVRPFDVSAFAMEISRLAGSFELRTELGQRGKAQVLERFMVRKNMADAVERINEVIESYSGRA